MNLRKYFLTSAIVVSLASITTGCSLFGGEEDTIQVSPSPEIKSAFPLKQIWSNSLSSDSKIYSLLSPAVEGNVVYAAGRGGQIKAMDLLSGKVLWNIDVSNSSLFSSQSALLSGGVSVDDKYVYVGSERATVYALDKTNGTIVWHKDVKGEVIAKPISFEKNLIIHTTNGFLQGLDLATGNDKWEVSLNTASLSLRGESVPATAYGAIIVGDDVGHVNAFYAQNGQLIWQQRISQPSGSTEIAKLNDVDTTPIIEQNRVYAVGYNGNIAALDLSNGNIIWKKVLGSIHSFVINDNQILVVDQNDDVHALNKNGGSVLWKQSELLHRQLTDPVIYQNYLVVGDFEGYLYLIDITSGNIISKTNVSSSGLQSKPIVADNKLIVQAKNGNVYAFTN